MVLDALAFSSLSFWVWGKPLLQLGTNDFRRKGLMSFAYWSVIAPIVALSSLIIGINLSADAFAKALGIVEPKKHQFK